MSLVEQLRPPQTRRPVQRGAFGRLLRSELRLVFGRRRNQVLLVALAGIPLLVGLAVSLSSGGPQAGEGPPFLDRVATNGLFLVFTSLTVSLPFFLPLTVGIVSGDAVAGEASAGTLRYLLTVPVTRTRLLVVKGVASLAFAAAAVLTVTLVGLVAGAALFGLDDPVLLSGDTVPVTEGLLRALGVATYVTLSLTGLVAVGLFVSTLTEVPVGAMATTVLVAVASSVLNALPQLSAIHGGLLVHHWFDFGELLRLQVDLGALVPGLMVQAAWVLVAAALAWTRFTSADVTA
jgi:ABC-2 type transport system permease protein